jgi:hypothetical protein
MQRWHVCQRCTRMKTAQITIQIAATLKSAGEKAAAADHRSLGGLIEMLLADYCDKHDLANEASLPSRSDAAPKAAEMAASAIDDIRDKSAPAEEQKQRKRKLIRGPKEFREIRHR